MDLLSKAKGPELMNQSMLNTQVKIVDGLAHKGQGQWTFSISMYVLSTIRNIYC